MIELELNKSITKKPGKFTISLAFLFLVSLIINTPSKILKIPKAFYKKANESKLLPEVLFWYSLKTINSEGYLKVSLIKSKTNLSYSRIMQLLQSLERLGFIKRNRGCLWLCSYNKIWKHFKYNLKGLNLIKIPVDNTIDIANLIQYYEVKNKLNQIQKKLPKKYIELLKEIGEIKSDTVKHQKAQLIFQKDIKRARKYYYESIRTNLSSQSDYNFESTLTCKKIADMFGYNSAKQGYLIQQKLQDKGLLHIINTKSSPNKRRLFISSSMNDTNHRKLISSINEYDSSFFYCNKYLFKQLPNVLIPLL